MPTDTRGEARVDDRRVISGIVHVLNPVGAGSTRRGIRAHEDALQSLRSSGAEGHLGHLVSDRRPSWRASRGDAHRLLRRHSPSLGERRETYGRPVASTLFYDRMNADLGRVMLLLISIPPSTGIVCPVM